MSRWDPLLAVQEHDTHLDQIHHQLEAMPERTQLESVMGELALLERSAGEVEAERHDVARDQKRIEDEVATLEERAAHEDKVLYSGTLKSPRDLQALQDEIASLRRRISQLEDRELELMEASEPLDARLGEIASQRATIDQRATALRAAIAEAEVALGAEAEQVQAERDQLAGTVEPDLLREYESLRPRLGGIAIARLVGAQCGGCHLTLSAVEVDRIKRLPPDEPARCEECGRLLAR